MRSESAAWLEFKGIKSSELGVKVVRLPDWPRPALRGTKQIVPGRDGALFLADGAYEEATVVASLRVPDGKQTEVSSWLTGVGYLRCSDRPGIRYRARAVTRYDYQKILPRSTAANFSVSLELQPFGYLYPPRRVELTAPGPIDGCGNVPARPVIEITGSGDIALMVGGTMLLLTAINGFITIDCDARIAYDGTRLMTNHLSGDWPLLPPEGCMINWTGNVTKLAIEPNWREI